MDTYVLIVVRLIHIVAAFFWVGTGFYSTVFVFPALVDLGDSGAQFVKALAKKRLFAFIFPVSAALTVLAGLVLYLRPGASGGWSNTAWAILSIGALAGIVAIAHGGAILGRMIGAYMQKAMSGSAQPGELAKLAAELVRHANISLILIIIAMLGMESARYWP
jgi:uncharacterized membrane protein